MGNNPTNQTDSEPTLPPGLMVSIEGVEEILLQGVLIHITRFTNGQVRIQVTNKELNVTITRTIGGPNG